MGKVIGLIIRETESEDKPNVDVVEDITETNDEVVEDTTKSKAEDEPKTEKKTKGAKNSNAKTKKG